MKKLILSALAASTCASYAQTILRDSTAMGPGYINQVYYDVKTGDKSAATVNNWDIAHTSISRDNCIRANHMNGVRVFMYPKGGVAAWSTVDTSGFYGWKPRWNDIHVVAPNEKGAFNLYNDVSKWKFGWGTYNPNTFEVDGDSLFIIGWAGSGGSWTKFVKFMPIKQKANGDLIFKYADLDGSNEMQDTLFQSAGTGMQYKYFKFGDKTKPVREPGNTAWDITFTRYYDLAFNPQSLKYEMYPVMGIESKRGTLVAKIKGPTWNSLVPDSASLVGTYTKKFSDDLTAIGSDWKWFNNVTFVVNDTQSYIIRRIRTGDTSYWLLHMTAFGGTANGKTVFDRVQLKNSLSAKKTSLGVVGIYPNPATSVLYFSVENQQSGSINARIFSLTGELVSSGVYDGNPGLNAGRIDISNLKSGVYFLQLEQNGRTYSTRFVNK